MKFVAVTSCPTGIAHTYMAAENLEQTGKELGHQVEVETQGSAGTVPLSDDIIAAADGVIYAADLEVKGKDRFAGKPFVDVGVKKAVHDPKAVLEAAIAAVENAPKAGTAEAEAAAAAAAAAPKGGGGGTRKVGVGTKVRQWLMTGVSYMIPFVAAGGILIALGFLFGGEQVVYKLYGGEFEGVTYENIAGSLPVAFSSGDFSALLEQAGFAGVLFVIGKIAFFMLVPILSGYIAFAIADRPGLVPGIVGGLICGPIGAGFLGGLVSGFIAGGMAYWLTRLRVPKGVRGVMPVVVIPLVTTLLIGVIMFLVVGPPVAAVQSALEDWLSSLSGGNAILLGAILGLMMAFDMGGPVNKAAYVFAAGGLTIAITEGGPGLQIMAAVMAAGMTPPLGMALATAVRKKLFTEAERENGLACWLLGASFVTEGAIPFAAAHPLRVIPSCMVGSAVTGALVMAFGNELRAPHGGIWVLPLISNPILYLVAIAAGMLITAGLVIVLMSIDARKTEEIAHAEDVAEGVAA